MATKLLYQSRPNVDSQLPEIVVGIVSGLVTAAVLKDNIASTQSVLATVASALIGFLIAYWVRHQLLSPAASTELAGKQASELAESIQRAEQASYAISSDWIDLWQSDAFTYYLALDQISSLAIYTRSQLSPLEGLTDNSAERETFLTDCRRLMTQIGAGAAPVREHRMRVLIYPEYVYTHYQERVLDLLRLHSVGRIPCIPLVSERLEAALSATERQSIQQLTTSQLGQDLSDKIPPQPRHRQGAVRRAAKSGSTLVFPDLLLIDPDYGDSAQLWWYTRAAVRCERANNSVRAAQDVFQILCNKGQNAIWANFTAANIGNIPITIHTDVTSAELFFSLDYYKKWLAWIDTSAGRSPDAQTLKAWLAGEHDLLVACLASGTDPAPIHVLDVGCGFGRHLLDLAKTQHVLTGLGIDVIPSMSAEAAREARLNAVDDRLYFCQDDATQLKTCRNAEFDVAICMTNTLGNLRRDKAAVALKQIGRVLKPHGRLLVSVYSPASVAVRLTSYRKVKLHVAEEGNRRIVAAEGLESAHFTEEELRQLITENGFRVKKTHQVGAIGVAIEAEKYS